MTLDPNSSLSKFFGLLFMAIRLGILISHFSVYCNSHFFANYFNIVSKPLVICMRCFFNIFKTINTRGLSPIGMCCIDLRLVSYYWPSIGLISGVKKIPAFAPLAVLTSHSNSKSLNFALPSLP